MADDLKAEAEAFARVYGGLFSQAACSSVDHVDKAAGLVSRHYRPNVTFFTNGAVTQFKTPTQAAELIEKEMRTNISNGMGTNLELLDVSKVEVYGQTLALCWLHWTFHPQAGSEFEGKDWSFTNIYGYRTTTGTVGAGWEFVVRDEEVNAMLKATGKSFEA